MDKERIAAAVKELLIAIGEDPEREGLQQTPERISRMYEEILAGQNIDPKNFLQNGRQTQ